MSNLNMLEAVKTLQERWGSLPPTQVVNYKELQNTYEQVVEELDEWSSLCSDIYARDSITDKHQKEFRDVTVDLIFYILQAVVRTGQAENFEKDFEKIYQNNLSKVIYDPKVVDDTLKMYNEQGVDVYCHNIAKHRSWVVKRQSDDKIMKPKGFVEVEL